LLLRERKELETSEGIDWWIVIGRARAVLARMLSLIWDCKCDGNF